MKKFALIATTALVAACSTNNYPVLPPAPVVNIQPQSQEQLEPSVRDMDPSAAIDGNLTYIYEEGREYKVFVPYGRVVPISLVAGDVFRELSAVDMSGWRLDDANSGKARRSRSILMVSSIPGEARRVQAVVVGSDRVYLLDLIPRKTGHKAVSFHKPPRLNASPPSLMSVSPYGISGPGVPWRPVSITDDGRQTTVIFPPDVGATGMPAVLAKGQDGTARPINSRMIEPGKLVADGVHQNLIMRLGGSEVEAVRQ